MSIGSKMGVAALIAALDGLIVPAFAQNDSHEVQSRPNHGVSMDGMSHGMMRGGMMAGGCSAMMQSMNNDGDGRPNSKWQKHPPRNPGNGG
jgi:hypothetical protein